MRIGIDYTAAINQSAGIGRFVRNLFREVTRLDLENQYVMIHATPNPGRVATIPDGPNVAEKQLRFRERTMTALWHRLHMPIPVDLLTGRLDLFHAPDFILPPLQKGISILTVHDLAFLIHPECADDRLLLFLERAVPRSCERADYIVTDSENTRNDVICLLDADPSRVFVVPGGVDAAFTPASEEAIADVRRRYNVWKPYVLAVGVIEPRKNLPRLIDAYARFRLRSGMEHQLVLAGGKGWKWEETFRTAEQCGFVDDIVFTGYVPDQYLSALYSGADVFALPSLYEGFGLPVLEAMACGTAVVCSDTSSLPEFAANAAILVSPDDTNAMADGLERICLDQVVRTDLRAKGLQRAAEFTWERSASLLLEVYDKVGKAA
jgi:glycosyltransferase involved in cell wall biosynthesis